MTTIPTTQALADANIDSLERLAIALGLFFAKHTGSLPSTSPSFEAVTFEVKETSNLIPETTISPINFADIPAKVAEYPAGIEWESRLLNLSGGYELIISPYTVVTATLQFTCYFPLNAETRLEAGTLLLNVAPFFTLSAPEFPDCSPSAEQSPDIPNYPNEINSAEQLMVWALLVLNASLYPENKAFIKILPKYEDGELRIDFDFPLDSQAITLNSYQLIGSAKRIVNGYLNLDTGIVSQIALDAYEVAKAEGYIGSRAQWLASLIGPKGDKGDKGDQGTAGAGVSWQGIWNSGTTYAKDDAVDYQGSSYIANATTTNEIPGISAKWDLWVSKGDKGDQGEDGKSAYQSALDNGFIGTEAQWLASLQGDDGQDSIVPGPAGATGSVSAASGLTLIHIATPSAPSAGNTIVYGKSDGKIYKRAAGGEEEAIGSGDNASSIQAAKIILQANANIPSATNFIIPFSQDGLKFDSGSFWSNVNPSRFTIPSNGIYLLSYGLGFSSNGSGARDMILRKNGSTLLEGANRPVPSPSAVSILGNSSLHSFSAGDYIELYSYQNSGSTLILYGESTVLYAACYMSILKVQ